MYDDINEQENRMIALAVKLAEEQLQNGTASAQVITHFLKLGSTKNRAELSLLEGQQLLTEAKVDSIKASKHSAELYEKALSAMRSYGSNIKEE